MLVCHEENGQGMSGTKKWRHKTIQHAQKTQIVGVGGCEG